MLFLFRAAFFLPLQAVFINLQTTEVRGFILPMDCSQRTPLSVCIVLLSLLPEFLQGLQMALPGQLTMEVRGLQRAIPVCLLLKDIISELLLSAILFLQWQAWG